MISNKNARYEYKNYLITIVQQHDSKRPSRLFVEDDSTTLVSVMIPYNLNYRVITLCDDCDLPLSASSSQ
jgi:hypothetical protein